MSLEDLQAEAPFSYEASRSGLVRIFYRNRVVTTLRGREGERFLARVEDASQESAQLLMAKVTGHFKHGTEKTARTRRPTR